MKKCIICFENKNDDEFSEEHIIPKAFGNNKLKIDCVCKKCNNQMGSEIDGNFAKNPGIRLLKQQISLSQDDNKTDYKFIGNDDEGNYYTLNKDFSKIKIQTRILKNKNNITIHTSNKEDAKEIIEKEYKRNKITKNVYDKAMQEIENAKAKKVYPEINIDCSLNLRTIMLELLKISYEYLFYKFGEVIFQLDDISNIRKILLKIINKEIVDESEYTRYINDVVLTDELCAADNHKNSEKDFNRYVNTIHCFSREGHIYVHVLINGFNTYMVCINNLDNVIKSDFCFKETF